MANVNRKIFARILTRDFLSHFGRHKNPVCIFYFSQLIGNFLYFSAPVNHSSGLHYIIFFPIYGTLGVHTWLISLTVVDIVVIRQFIIVFTNNNVTAVSSKLSRGYLPAA